ncbi:MAG: hypothetical protein IPI28_15295 [Candidatus Omnitrophica bacterium]|nr:hypothetical protein [Candidatus Omnitrophota bacterium]
MVKVALGSGANPPTRAEALTLDSGENSLESAVIDPSAGYVYYGTFTSAGKVVKVDYALLGAIYGTEMTMVEEGHLNDVRFYSHSPSGNVRLAIYDDQEPRNLLWESGSTGITKAEEWLTVPISSGTPTLCRC